MPAIAFVKDKLSAAKRSLSLVAALIFAAFVTADGIPTLRHDWAWPIDRTAIGSFMSESFNGWLSTGLGTSNPHPTTYLIALPIGTAMWFFGPLAALVLLCVAIGYSCMRCGAAAASLAGDSPAAAFGLGLIALFNPWVYNEVVAGHLVMVLAYVGLIGCFAEMLRGRNASAIRLALWAALIEAQLQFFIVAMIALVGFAVATRKWLPPVAGAIVALPSVIGIVAERGVLLRIPYSVEWQTNQSVPAPALLGFGGYFPGYADRLGIAAEAVIWGVLAIAIIGVFVARNRRSTIGLLCAVIVVYVVILGLRGPIAGPYAWVVRNVPESGVFRELYDLTGLFAALVILLAAASAARLRALGYAALAIGIVLPITWLLNPPGLFWVGARAYPHPSVVAPPFSRVAFLPGFQPVGLRDGSGDGADPDVHNYPGPVATINEYFPTYPVDMALARYQQDGDATALRVLGVARIIARPWLRSQARGGIGWAATSLQPGSFGSHLLGSRGIVDPLPLMTQCDAPRIVAFANRVGDCDVFFGDAPGYAPVRPIMPPGESIDPRAGWIDARLTFAEVPVLAQALGGVLTQSVLPERVDPGAWLLAYIRGELRATDGRPLARRDGSFVWLRVPSDAAAVQCAGLCELVAQTATLPNLQARRPPTYARALQFRRFAPWLYVVYRDNGGSALLRFNERYDRDWLGLSAARLLPHLRVDGSVNGWLLPASARRIVLLEVTAVLQLLAEVVGTVCVVLLLKALTREPTKRVV